MRSKVLGRILKDIPLEVRLEIAIQAHFIYEGSGSFLIPLDINGNDIPEAVEHNQKCLDKAKPIIELVMNELEEWKKDGCP
jgi:hypothetical protein